MGKNIRGINLIFILLLGALLLMVWSSSMNQMQDNYTRAPERLKRMYSAVITQNRESAYRLGCRSAQGRAEPDSLCDECGRSDPAV